MKKRKPLERNRKINFADAVALISLGLSKMTSVEDVWENLNNHGSNTNSNNIPCRSLRWSYCSGNRDMDGREVNRSK